MQLVQFSQLWGTAGLSVVHQGKPPASRPSETLRAGRTKDVMTILEAKLHREPKSGKRDQGEDINLREDEACLVPISFQTRKRAGRGSCLSCQALESHCVIAQYFTLGTEGERCTLQAIFHVRGIEPSS